LVANASSATPSSSGSPVEVQPVRTLAWCCRPWEEIPRGEGDIPEDPLAVGQVGPKADPALALHHQVQPLARPGLGTEAWLVRADLYRKAVHALLPAQHPHRPGQGVGEGQGGPVVKEDIAAVPQPRHAQEGRVGEGTGGQARGIHHQPGALV
jgi:hypothetical protein